MSLLFKPLLWLLTGLVRTFEWLVAPLQQLCTATAQPHQLAIETQLPNALLLPTSTVEELILITREALHNVVKHSGAATVTVRLAQTPTVLTLTIQDRGKGFVLPAKLADLAHSHYGLRGIQERVGQLGGVLTVESMPTAGTTVTVEIFTQ